MSKGASTSWKASIPQYMALNQLMPLMQQLSAQGMSQQLPQAPTAPSMQGVLSDIPMYDIPQAPMPTKDWYSSLSPEVMGGLWAPYDYGAKQLTTQLNASGQAGSARGGYSGAAGAALGELYSRGAKDVGMQAWQMSQPGLFADYTSQLQRNLTGYGNLTRESLADHQNLINQQQQNYQAQMMQYQLPYSMLGMTPQFMPTGVVQQGGSPALGALGGAAGGALSGAALGSAVPGIGTGLGAIGGGLMGLFGGLA